MRSPLQGGRLLIGLAAAGAALAVGGVASATIPGAGGNYTACLSKTSGVLRLIDPSRGGPSRRRSHCLRGEQRISWSRIGATGRAGATSPRGTAGIAGTLGTIGPAGGPGATGPAGTGFAGPTGATGQAGGSGASGGTGPSGPTGLSGTTGTSGPVGASGATGPTGTTGTTGPAAVSAFSGHIVTVPNTGSGTLNLVFGAPAGLSNSNSPERTVDTLSPSVPITIQDLEASQTGPPVPANDQIDISVRVNGSVAISCVMSAGANLCDTGLQTAAVPAGSTLSIGVQSNADLGTTIFGFDLLFGFEATSS